MVKTEPLVIGELAARVPVMQGGMGVGVSLSGLAGAVAAEGGIGIISTAQIGYREPDYDREPTTCNLRAIPREIQKARMIAGGGIIGVNIMVATKEYDSYVKAAIEAGADLIVSGAGLPMELPALAKGSSVKLLPIVSSLKSVQVIMKYWQKKHDRLPDAVVIEGPLAGGHLGFSMEALEHLGDMAYEEEVKRIIAFVNAVGEEHHVRIPVIMAGGIYTRSDMEHYLDLGAAGVQMATRFVTTYECDADDGFKQSYLDAGKEDIVLVKSPVGMPGRAIRNAFIEKTEKGMIAHGRCHACIRTCNPSKTPYCITEALVNAVTGKSADGLLFCGANAYRADKLEHVKEIMDEFRP